MSTGDNIKYVSPRAVDVLVSQLEMVVAGFRAGKARVSLDVSDAYMRAELLERKASFIVTGTLRD